MERAVGLVSLLVLGSAWTLQAGPVLPEPVILTQESFNLSRFMGKWYEIAVVSTCPHYMQRKKGNPVIVPLELQHVASESNFSMTTTTFRNGSCKQTSTDYGLTNTPGRFFYHNARFAADVDSFVVHTDYDEYAMMLLLSTERPSGNQTTIAKLYGRAMNVSAAVLDNFKTLVRQHDMNDGAIIKNENKGECVPGEQTVTPQPQVLVSERSKRNVVPPAQQEDAGDQGERTCGY